MVSILYSIFLSSGCNSGWLFLMSFQFFGKFNKRSNKPCYLFTPFLIILSKSKNRKSHDLVQAYRKFSNKWKEVDFHANSLNRRAARFTTMFAYVRVKSLMFSCPESWNAVLLRTTANTLHRKWSFSLRISSVNVTKSAVSCGFGYI